MNHSNGIQGIGGGKGGPGGPCPLLKFKALHRNSIFAIEKS